MAKCVVPATTAEQLARVIAVLPQDCLRSDRQSAFEGLSLPYDEAMANEFRHGMAVIAGPGVVEGRVPVPRRSRSRRRPSLSPGAS